METYAVKILDISKEKLDNIILLSTSERKCKIERFINKEDKIRILIGEVLIRTIIVKKLSIRNKHVIFDKNQYGKPYLMDYQNFNFNISHSGEFVVCALEKMNTIDTIYSITQKYVDGLK